MQEMPPPHISEEDKDKDVAAIEEVQDTSPPPQGQDKPRDSIMKELERRNKGAMEMIMMKTERKRETERRKYTKKKSKKVVLMKQPEFPQDGQLETRVSNLKEIKVTRGLTLEWRRREIVSWIRD